MGKNYRVELVGVFGDPVDENPTVVLEEAAFRELGLNYKYLNFHFTPECLPQAIEGLKAMKFRGINLTIPHKRAVIPLLDDLSEAARTIGAVNTVVVREDGTLFGENTDGKGFVASLNKAGIPLKGKKMVLLGAGGAARAIAVESAFAGVDHITVVNRNQARGRELAELIQTATQASAEFTPWDKTYAIPVQTDILVNATSVGLYPNVEDCPDIALESISPEMAVCDVITNHPMTVLLKSAKAKGAKIVDGLGMLVHQGAIGFELWTGKKAPVEVMHRAICEEFGIEI